MNTRRNRRKRLGALDLVLLITTVQAWLLVAVIPLAAVLPQLLAYLATAVLLGCAISLLVQRSKKAADFGISAWTIHLLLGSLTSLVGVDQRPWQLPHNYKGWALWGVCCAVTSSVGRLLSRHLEMRAIVVEPVPSDLEMV